MREQCVLVVADGPLSDDIATSVRTNGYEALTCQTPLEAIHALERHGGRIAYALLSADTPRALELCDLLADEYPGVQSLLLSI